MHHTCVKVLIPLYFYVKRRDSVVYENFSGRDETRYFRKDKTDSMHFSILDQWTEFFSLLIYL